MIVATTASPQRIAIAPSLQFLLAVLAFGEPLTRAHLVCFGLIWTALLVFVWEGVRVGRSEASARKAALGAAEAAG